MNIARSEARETHYWIRLVGDTGLVGKTRLKSLLAEADELICILTTIVRKSRAATAE